MGLGWQSIEDICIHFLSHCFGGVTYNGKGRKTEHEAAT